MWEELTPKTQNIKELEQKEAEVEQKLAELKADTFGTDSEDAEEKARSFFKEVGMDEGTGKTEEVDEKKQELDNIRHELNQLREDVLRDLTEVQFPFNETIDQRDGKVVFPFTDELPEDTVDVIRGIVQNGGDAKKVELEQEALVANTEDVNEALDDVEEYAKKLRKSAQRQLNTEDYAKELSERDIKIQRMLYELYESDEPLAKKELEMATGVEKGGLRGVLYHVHDNEPYLIKENKKYRLSDIGEDVVEKFLDKFGEPNKPEKEGEQAEEDREDDQQENQATLNSTGEDNE